MSPQNLLVQIDSTKANEGRLTLALNLAKRFDAHLTGAYTVPALNPLIYADGNALTGVYQEAPDAIERDGTQAKTNFESRCQEAGVDYEWLSERGRESNNLILAGRYADLTIVGQFDPTDTTNPEPGLAEEVATGLGRPVLVVPHIGGAAETGSRVLVAWDASREAARAVSDAMPLLQAADQVDVLHMYSDAKDQFPAARQLCEALSRAGVEAKPHELLIDDIEVGDAMLSRAADFGTNLVVMGAYGHSRFREMVLGGATRDMLDHMTVPTLMAH